MAKDKIPAKRRAFIEHYTNKKNPVTYGNGLQSVLASYPNVTSKNAAGQMANEILNNPKIAKEIEKKILKKEDIQHNLAEVSSLLRSSIGEKITEDNIPMVREFREYNLAHAKINGDLAERMTNNYTQIIINGAINNPFSNAEDGEVIEDK